MNRLDGIEHAKKIWILDQVLEAGSFRAAALRVKVSTPAISQSISSLERIVGKPLVVRQGGKVRPTDAAIQLLDSARPAIKTLSEIVIGAPALMSELPNISWISLGIPESLSTILLPNLNDALRAKIPKLKLTVRVARSAALASMIRKGELCAALVDENEALGNLSTVEISFENLGFFVSRKISEPSRSWDRVKKMSVGAISPASAGYPRYYSKFIEATLGKRYQPGLLCDTYEALRASAASGSTMVILPGRLGHQSVELIEVTPPICREDDPGLHKILLVSQSNCDPGEIRFLTSVLSGLFEKFKENRFSV